MATLGVPQNTIEILKKHNIKFQKKFGQNFLIDTHVLEKIVSAAGITEDDFVLEIGPGIGTMTQYLCENAREVMAVEIDKSLIPVLSETLSSYNNVTVINKDILKTDINKIAQDYNDGKPLKVVANLPYYITTPIIMGLFEGHVPLGSITVMVQKEVAQRMQAVPGTKDYGALSLAVQYYSDAVIVANVPANCFIPRPNVGSAVIHHDHFISLFLQKISCHRGIHTSGHAYHYFLIHRSFLRSSRSWPSAVFARSFRLSVSAAAICMYSNIYTEETQA